MSKGNKVVYLVTPVRRDPWHPVEGRVVKARSRKRAARKYASEYLSIGEDAYVWVERYKTLASQGGRAQYEINAWHEARYTATKVAS